MTNDSLVYLLGYFCECGSCIFIFIMIFSLLFFIWYLMISYLDFAFSVAKVFSCAIGDANISWSASDPDVTKKNDEKVGGKWRISRNKLIAIEVAQFIASAMNNHLLSFYLDWRWCQIFQVLTRWRLYHPQLLMRLFCIVWDCEIWVILSCFKNSQCCFKVSFINRN